MISKGYLLKLAAKEFATTMKVLKAYPKGQESLKPSDNSRSAMDIAKTFVFEMYLFDSYMFGDEVDRSIFKTYAPASMAVVTADFEKHGSNVLERLEQLDEAGLTKSIPDFGGVTFSASEFAMMLIHDQIHHRGQLTIYVRLAGGKIPSIYGPSGDDSSTNL